jgi:hypothetical protein
LPNINAVLLDNNSVSDQASPERRNFDHELVSKRAPFH